jgi:hypothetical protein
MIEVPPRLSRIEPIQNVENLKLYVSRPRDIGPSKVHLPPDVLDDGAEPEYEVEDILLHRTKKNKKNEEIVEYLVRFLSYGPEDDLWLPAENLVNAPDIVKQYWARQKERPRQRPSTKRQQAPRLLTRLGHIWIHDPVPCIAEGGNDSRGEE